MSESSSYTVKEVLAQMDARISARLDRIEAKLDRKADQGDVSSLGGRISKIEMNMLDDQDAAALRKIDLQRLMSQVEELSANALTIANVKETIGQVMQDSEARGWTTRERVMGLILFAITLVSFALNLFQSG